MNAWRVGFALLLVAVLGPALVFPFVELADPAAWFWSADDLTRLGHLAGNTLLLVAGTLALSLPAGTLLAVFLFRTSFPGRSLLLFVLILLLFVPLPIVVSSWQALLGSGGLGWWQSGAGRPWATGLGAALWIHALAAVPWVTCIVGVGLQSVEPELEDEAAQVIGPWRVLLFVTLPRARASLLAAALFVGLTTAAEISVTDMMLVSTLAEEVHTQFIAGERAGLARTLVVTLPGLLLTWLAVLAATRYLEKTLPPLTPQAQAHRAVPVRGRRLAVGGVVLLAAPLLLLVWTLGRSGHPLRWSPGVAWHHLRGETILLGADLLATLATALVTGCLIALLALVTCWLARDSRWLRGLVVSVLTWAWVLPAPVVGIGLGEAIMTLDQQLPPGPWSAVLYHGPSPAPLMWVQTIRILPAAVLFLWPMVRLLPRELFELAQLEGAGAWGELMHIVWPLSRRAVGVCAAAATALCLGEIGASIRVQTPGWEPFTKLLFDRMHYGVDNNVAALGVLLLGGLVVLGGAAGVINRWGVRRSLPPSLSPPPAGRCRRGD